MIGAATSSASTMRNGFDTPRKRSAADRLMARNDAGDETMRSWMILRMKSRPRLAACAGDADLCTVPSIPASRWPGDRARVYRVVDVPHLHPREAPDE